jgi:GR25 family glycosyltransferase involved in LPS biosynthesis/tetratricopeptide (TPR) repeat protein
MIVKDEAHIIEKTFDNLLSQIVFDYWVISDTGSSDGTQDLIKKYFANKKIPGELVEHKWRDFGYNRTEALKSAFKKSDYILIFDADDSIHGDFKLPPKLTKDFYKLQFGKGFTYYRPLLITGQKPTSFIGVLHEFLKLNEGTPTEENIPGNYYVESGRLGNRSKDGDKYLKDALILKAAYEKEVATGGGLANRYAFYCGQSYKDCGKIDEAIEWYTLIADKLNSWVQERYYSCVTLGHLYKQKNNTEKALAYYLKSDMFDTERKEGIIYACELLKDKGLHMIVTLLYEKHCNYDRNPRDKLFMHRDIYDDVFEFNAAVSYSISGNTKAGYSLFKEILTRQIANNNIIKVSYANLQSFPEQLKSDKTSIELFYKLNSYIQTCDNVNEISAVWNILFEKHRSTLTQTPKNMKIPKRNCEVLLTMTSCKRYDLFHQTVNSMMLHWNDKSRIDKWVCIDDNSSKDDRKLMKATYPWIEFYMKTPEEKGHRQSMNIIWNMLKLTSAKYWIHIEDDFLFHTKRSYIEDSIKFLERHSDIPQVLFNRAYGETIEQLDNKGYLPLEPGFAVHEHKQGAFPYPNCHYWPHYSFRPGVIRAEVILQLGNFDSPNTFFEMDYARKWTDAGYKTAFFDSINCRHIGRLTSERNSDAKNAYDLNGEGQFNKTNIIKVINLKRRPDRKEAMIKKFKDEKLTNWDFVEAVDGKQIKPTIELKNLFEGNDFGSRRGVIGCAVTHYNLWKALLADTKTNYYVIMEDDINFVPDFSKKFEALKPIFEKEDYVLLGYSMFQTNRDATKEIYVTQKDDIKIADLNRNLYIGGAFCYSINKRGAKLLVDYITVNGIKHGIDYIMKIFPDLKCKELQPSIAYTNWYEKIDQEIDTDIQKDYESINFSSLDFLADQFNFIPGKDHGGDDLFFKPMPLEEMMKEAVRIDSCEGFNTLGYFKLKANNITSSPYFGENDGIYVKKRIYLPTYTPSEKSRLDKGLTGKNYCIIHSCHFSKDGLDILNRLVDKVVPFQNVFEKIYIINIGEKVDLNKYGPGFIIKNISDDVKLYELETLNIIRDFSIKTPNSNILYLHTKGIFHTQDPMRSKNVEDWKDMMFYHLLNKNKQCVELLKSYDTVGCNLIRDHDRFGPHFSGNFWWATTNHISKLKEFTEFNDRHIAEWWICSESAKTFSLHDSRIDHYWNAYPPEKYINNIRIKMMCNWCSGEQLCKEWSNMCESSLTWKNIEMTHTDDNVDFYIIVNSPPPGQYFDPERTIVFQMEPWVEDVSKPWGVKSWGQWAQPDPSKFLAVRGRRTPVHNNAFWQLELPYNAIKYGSPIKSNVISSICSSKYFDEGHIARIDMLKYFETKDGFKVDIYNQDNKHGFKNYKGPVTPYVDKSKGMAPYKYYFMIENNYEKDFITEKIWEPILCESLVFYHGCPNVSDYIDSQAFVQIDVTDFEKTYQLIKTAIEEDWWSQRIDVIRKEKNKILEELSFFPVVRKITEQARASL